MGKGQIIYNSVIFLSTSENSSSKITKWSNFQGGAISFKKRWDTQTLSYLVSYRKKRREQEKERKRKEETSKNVNEMLQAKCGFGFPRWLSAKESACQCMRCRRGGFAPELGRSPGGGIAWKTPWTQETGRIVHSVAKSQWLSNWAHTSEGLCAGLK